MRSADVTGQKEPLKYAFTQSPAAWLWRMWECELRAQDRLASILPSRDSVCFFCPHPTPTGFCPNKECFCTLENICKSVIGRAERLSEPVRYREPFRTILQAQGSVTLDSVSGSWRGVGSLLECASLLEKLVLGWVFPVTGPPYNSPPWSQEAEGHCAARGLVAKPGSARELRAFHMPRGGRIGGARF